MSRPRSENKRSAIFGAAISLFADRGAWSTPMSAIAASAGVAQGTVFIYFRNKEDLLNEIYRLLTREIADALMSAYPKAADARIRFRHMWDRYVNWGVAHPDRHRVYAQLQASESITAESRALGSAALKEIERLAKDSIRKKRIRNHPLPYLAAVMVNLAETTVEFVARNKNSRVDYTGAGFEIFWAGIADL